MPTQRENGRSKLVSVRLPHEMIAQLKGLAETLERPYQTVMKEAIEYGMNNGLVRYSNTCLQPQPCVRVPGGVQGTGDMPCSSTPPAAPRRKAKGAGAKRENGIRKNIRSYEAPHVRESVAKLRGGKR